MKSAIEEGAKLDDQMRRGQGKMDRFGTELQTN